MVVYVVVKFFWCGCKMSYIYIYMYMHHTFMQMLYESLVSFKGTVEWSITVSYTTGTSWSGVCQVSVSLSRNGWMPTVYLVYVYFSNSSCLCMCCMCMYAVYSLYIQSITCTGFLLKWQKLFMPPHTFNFAASFLMLSCLDIVVHFIVTYCKFMF